MFSSLITNIATHVLFTSCIAILIGSLILTYKTRAIQLRALYSLFQIVKQLFSLKKTQEQEGEHTVTPYRALMTAMSTTLGISSVVAPVIAIRLGGPGALLGFLLTAFLGSAATYVEVQLSLKHRKTLSSGQIIGGPMHYLSALFSTKVARWYALCCLLLMTAWSGGQANQLAAILDSPLLSSWRVPVSITGLLFSLLVMVALLGGIKRISALSAKIVPCMFVLYFLSNLWIVACNLEKVFPMLQLVFSSFFSWEAVVSGSTLGGIVGALRWGVFKGIQACEAGLGTQSFPHSSAKTTSPESQATLAMLSTYTAGAVAFLSGFVALLTGTWQDSSLPLGISMVAASFAQYFSFFGIILVTMIVILFSFGTSVGNSYNGLQCFTYLTKGKSTRYYIFFTGLFLFIGAHLEVKTFWSLMDIVLALTLLPHMAALTWNAFAKKTSAIPVDQIAG